MQKLEQFNKPVHMQCHRLSYFFPSYEAGKQKKCISTHTKTFMSKPRWVGPTMTLLRSWGQLSWESSFHENISLSRKY